MSETEREHWTQRWAEREYHPRGEPSAMLVTWAPRIPRGRALDLACGNGRNALYVAEQGFAVDAVDIAAPALQLVSDSARERGLTIHLVEADLDQYTPPLETYDLITAFFFLNRDLFPRVRDALKPGGYVIYEHHYLSEAKVGGPTDPAWRLRPNELLEFFSGFRIRFFSEGLEEARERTDAMQRLVAQKPSAPDVPGPDGA